MPFQIVHGDILEMGFDAIINPSDEQLSGNGGLDYQIHSRAGSWMDMNCRDLAPICPGQAVITEGFELPCRGVIHTAAPWYTGRADEIDSLRRCYKNSLQLAEKHRFSNIGLPLIGSGFRGFPKDLVLKIAVEEIRAYIEKNDHGQISLVVFDRSQYQPDLRLLSGFERYRMADKCICCESIFISDEFEMPSGASEKAKPKFSPGKKFEPDESFSQMVLRKIDEKGMTDPECYHKANVDRRVFSKLRSQQDYQPKKTTAVALAIALELELPECRQLLRKAGYSLSDSILFDQIIEYCIVEGIYDIFEINQLLFEHDQSQLC